MLPPRFRPAKPSFDAPVIAHQLLPTATPHRVSLRAFVPRYPFVCSLQRRPSDAALQLFSPMRQSSALSPPPWFPPVLSPGVSRPVLASGVPCQPVSPGCPYSGPLTWCRQWILPVVSCIGPSIGSFYAFSPVVRPKLFPLVVSSIGALHIISPVVPSSGPLQWFPPLVASGVSPERFHRLVPSTRSLHCVHPQIPYTFPPSGSSSWLPPIVPSGCSFPWFLLFAFSTASQYQTLGVDASVVFSKCC